MHTEKNPVAAMNAVKETMLREFSTFSTFDAGRESSMGICIEICRMFRYDSEKITNFVNEVEKMLNVAFENGVWCVRDLCVGIGLRLGCQKVKDASISSSSTGYDPGRITVPLYISNVRWGIGRLAEKEKNRLACTDIKFDGQALLEWYVNVSVEETRMGVANESWQWAVAPEHSMKLRKRKWRFSPAEGEDETDMVDDDPPFRPCGVDDEGSGAMVIFSGQDKVPSHYSMEMMSTKAGFTRTLDPEDEARKFSREVRPPFLVRI